MDAKKVLIVDDETGFTSMMLSFLKSQKYEASAANNLEEAINLFKRERPKVVLLDVNMPIVNGDKFMPVLRSLNPSVQIIVISGFSKEDVESRFKPSDYFAFFKKGEFVLEELKQSIEKAFTI
jgi:DNA-binding NtrC family response regulator